MDNQLPSDRNQTKNEYNLTAAAYLRVSLARQSKEGYSLEAQKEKIKEFAEKKGWKLPEKLIFKDEKPATKVEGHELDELSLLESFVERPKLTELLQSAQRREFSHLVIYSRDRLSRVVEDTIALELFFRRCNIQLYYIRDGEDFEDTNSEIGRLLHIIFTSLAEMEGNLLSSRVKDGCMACIGKGRWAGGKIPLGYVPVFQNKDSYNKKKRYTILEKSDFESKLVEEVFNLYFQGMGYRKIANSMNNKYGFMTWTKSKIESIIKNQTYTGQIAWDRRGGRRNPRRKNNNPLLSPLEPENTIITADEWDKIVAERQKRDNSKDAHYYDTSFILRDKLVCSNCKRIMKARNPGTKKTNVYKCANSKEERELCNTIVPAHLVESKFAEYMRNNILSIHNTDIFWNEYDKEFDRRIVELSKLIDEINNRLNKYSGFIEKLKKAISTERDEYLLNAFHTQYVIYQGLINKYKETLNYYSQKAIITKKSKSELDSIVRKFLPGLFIEKDSKELIRIRREFIIHFIDKVIVRYNCETKQVIIEKIEFIPPEFI